MSLHQLAQQVQSKGRGEDTQLIHMTPKEIQGLQALAMSHGGSLTINPETGLVEAGFLSSILPTLLGVGLSFIPGVGPMMAAGLVGGGTALATGSLQKGLMAGLGAYGGAGLGAGLAGAGAEAGASALSAVPQASIPATIPGAIPEAAASMLPNATTPLAQAINTAGASNMSSLAAGSPAASMFAPQLTAANQAVSMAQAAPTFSSNAAAAGRGFSGLTSPTGIESVWNAMPKGSGLALGTSVLGAMTPDKFSPPKQDQGMIRPYTLSRTQNYPQGGAAPVYGQPFDSSERTYFNNQYTAGTPYAAPGPEYKAATGGLTALAVGGPVEEMSAQNAVGQNTGYPMAELQSAMYANPQVQRPMSTNVVSPSGDVAVDPYTGEQKFADGGMPDGHLGSYSDGGRLLRGPGDGVSDDIPASIGDKQPARLADGEFVVPARIVSELGNGSTEAGARQLYKMMERVQQNRSKSVGKDKVAVDAKSAKFLPA